MYLLFSVIAEVSVLICISIYLNFVTTHFCIDLTRGGDGQLHFYPENWNGSGNIL